MLVAGWLVAARLRRAGLVCCVGMLVASLVGWLQHWLVGCNTGWLVATLVGCLVGVLVVRVIATFTSVCLDCAHVISALVGWSTC